MSTPWLWHAAYALIIAGEGLCGLLLLLGALALWRVRKASGAAFDAAKSLAIVGATLGFLVWFLGFMVVGGEWFLMWQSSTWNGQDAAFRFYATLLGVLIFLNQSDADVGNSALSKIQPQGCGCIFDSYCCLLDQHLKQIPRIYWAVASFISVS